MQPRPAGKPGGFVNVTTNYSLGAVSVTTNNANHTFFPKDPTTLYVCYDN